MIRSSGLVARSGAYLGGTVAQLLATFALLPVLTRALPAEEYGAAVTALVLGQVLTLVVAAGLPVAILRTYLESVEGRVLAGRVGGAALVISTALSGLLLTTVSLWGPAVAAGPASRRLLPLAVLLGWAQGLLESGLALLRAAERPRPFVSASLIRTVGGPVLGLVLVALAGRSAGWYVGGLVIAALLAAIVALVRGGACPPGREAWVKLRTELPVALPGVPHGLGMMALAVGDRIVIERILDVSEAGRYHAAYLFGTVGIIVIQAVNNAWSPLVVGADDESRWRLHRDVTSAVAVVVGSLAAAVALGAPAILAFALPADLRSPELALVTGLVAAGSVLFVLYAAAGHVLTAVGWTAPLAIVTPVVAGLNLLGNTVAVSRWGLTGAGVTTAVSYGLLSAGVWVVARRRTTMIWPWWPILAGSLAVVALTLVARELPDERWWLVLRGGASVVLVGLAGVGILRRSSFADSFGSRSRVGSVPLVPSSEERT